MQALPQPGNPGKILTGIILSVILYGAILYSGKILALFGITGISFGSSLIISRLMFWVFIFLLYVYVIKVERQKFLLWRSQNNSVLFFIISFIVVLFCLIAGSVMLEAIEKYFGKNDNSQKLKDLIEVFRHNKTLLFFTVVTAAIVEELYFRAYLVSRLQIICKNIYLPVIISSILFGLAHAGFNNASQIINTTFIGLVSAIYYSKYRNITVLIAVHFFIDMVGLYSRM